MSSVSFLVLSIAACTAPAGPEGEVPTEEMPVPTESSSSSDMVLESSSDSSVSSESTTSEESSSDSSVTDSSAVSDFSSTSDVSSSADTSSSAEETSASSDDSASSASADSSSSLAARVIEVSVTNWSFTPSAITAKKGEVLELRLVGGEGVHSFTSEALNLHVSLAPGETKTISIPTDVVGTFTFRCTIPCGPGHSDMKGEIVITE